jgi:hypothetical protein
VLSPEELAELEASLLPTLERHHLRLLAHSLRSLQAAAGRRSGGLPTRSELLAWALGQAELQADPGFCQTFLDQLQRAGSQLETIAQTTLDPNQPGTPIRPGIEPMIEPGIEPANRPTPSPGILQDPAGPLGLELADLVAWARHQADQRIAKIRAPESSP